MKQDLQDHGGRGSAKLKFVLFSLFGVFLFMVPLPYTEDGNKAFNIPLGFAKDWLGNFINGIEINGWGLVIFLACLITTYSFLGSVLAYTAKPAFMMNSPKLKELFRCHPVYLISKAVAFVLAWMVFFRKGPEWILSDDEGAGLMMDILAGSNGGIMAIFFLACLAIPLLTEFGIMEFIGTLVRKALRFLFTLPGRSSIDLMGSWFSDSASSIMITRDQLEKGFYTGREAASICVNFTLVSLPFTFVVANEVGLLPYFGLFYLVICIVSILLAIVMPRIWPLSHIKDEYLPEVGKQIEEEQPMRGSLLSQGLKLAAARADRANIPDYTRSVRMRWLNIFTDLVPIILAWGAIATIIANQTPVFQWLSWPLGQFMRLLQVEGAMEYAHTTLVGFIDMYLPAILLGADAPIRTRFIIGTLSIVQIVFMAETGILILKSKIPLNLWQLFAVFIIRTILALPLIVLFTWLLFRP
ncbi:MAG: YjiH family protein [Treponema sp.]|nr:YjiH family protein [Treponema sp.]